MQNKNFPIFCFGKLPTFSDFIRYNANVPEVANLDQWIRKGLYFSKNGLRRQLGDYWLQAPIYCSVFFPDGSSRAVVAAFRMSHDRSGRRYPFMIAALVDPGQFGYHRLPFIPIIFRSFFDQSAKFIQDAFDHGTDMGAIANFANSLKVPLDPDYSSLLRPYHEHTQQRRVADLFLDRGESEDFYRYLLFRNLTEILIPLQLRDSPSQTTLGLKFPIGSPSDHSHSDAASWIDMSYRLLGNPEAKSYYFWAATADQPYSNLFLFFRRPSPSFFVHLLKSDTSSESICDLAYEGPRKIESLVSYIPPVLHPLLRRDETTFADFLKEAWKLKVT